MRLYLAGPMRACPAHNHPAFHRGAELLRAAGHEVFSPAEHTEASGLDGDDPAALRVLLGADLAWITAHADAVVVLPGWHLSLGATAEAATARALGLPVWDVGAFLVHGSYAPQAVASA